MRICLLLALLVSCATLQAQNSQLFSPLVKQAYANVWKYKLTEAENCLNRDKSENIAHLYVADTKWFIEVFATENTSAYNTYKVAKENSLNKLEAGPKSLPFYFFAKAEIYLHSAILKLKFGEYASAAWEINKAYRLLKEGNSKYPNFLLLRRDLLFLQALVGTVPENYSWMLKILGFEGELKPAMAQYAEVTKALKTDAEYKFFLPETQLIQAYLTHHLLNNPDAAWRLMDEASADYTTNPISAFARANLALHQKKNEIALQTLQTYKSETPEISHLDYYQGLAKLQRGDGDAGFYLARYIKHFKGSSYIKDAYLKLGWAFLLNGDTKNYTNSMLLVQRYGKTTLEEDRNALRESKKAALPSTPLLRARLLFDGGYYQKALENLKNTRITDFSPAEQAEYYYRLARIQESLNLNKDALENYGTVIVKFSSLEEYFAPAACYYSGMIWEKYQNKEKAKYFYKKCQTYKNYIYKNSFDQKALAGLKRLE